MRTKPMDMDYRTGLLLSLALLSAGCASATGAEPAAVAPAAAAREAETVFGVEHDGERVRFTVPDRLLGRDMALMSRIARAQTDLALGGEHLSPNMVVRWEREGDRILLRAPSHEAVAPEGSPLHIAVENSNFAPILAAFDIAERRGPASVIDVTDLYLGEGTAFGLDRGRRERHRVRGFDRNRSHLVFARAFPENVEVRVVRTYAAEAPPSGTRGGTISYEVNHSMILLPEEPMRPRLYDERVGYINIGQTYYADDAQQVEDRRYIRRFRLEPSDTAAFLRGELVDPVKPIVWYIDPATPEWMRPYFEAGIREWVPAFERAGFRNAVQVRVAPTPEEDPDFDLLDARYSVIRYVATPVRSANAFGDVADPRSGEVLRGHINMYHAVQERLRWWLLSQAAAADPRFRTRELPREEMGEALRYVVSHEMAHAVGLPHNQHANFVFPVDSLRDPEFVERRGHSASSVGRTRFNYIAQPGDGVPVERRIGAWDEFAVMWGYRPIIEAGTAEEEKPVLNRWVTAHADEPWFRFGYPQFGLAEEWDPYRQTEGLSNDPIRAAEYGMLNLHRAASNLVDWVAVEGEDHSELENHYLQLMSQWGRYMQHADSHVGGSYTHLKRFGEEGPVYTAVPAEDQRRAMRFLDEHVLSTPEWLLDHAMLRRLEHAGAVERVRAYQVMAVERLLDHHRLARLIEQESFLGAESYAPWEMLDDLRGMVWRELSGGGRIDAYRRNLQRGYLRALRHLLEEAEAEVFAPPRSGNLRVGSDDDPPLNAALHVGDSDIRPLVRDQLVHLRGEVQRARSRATDRMTRLHLDDALHRIDALLEG